MRKFKLSLCLVLAVLMLLPCVAGAVSFTNEADTLKNLGLFKGTNKGYELDRAPTRAEAAVMLVRFLGKEADAASLKWKAPFGDVPDWAKPYVQYLYENSLTSGTGKTTYSPDDTCSAQMYATFLLRALGYSDKNGDFKYEEAIKTAKEKGIINGTNCDEAKFLRDHMVGMSYISLTLPTKDGKYDALIYKLAADGSVSKNEADKFMALNDIASGGDEVGDTYLLRYSDHDSATEWEKNNITDVNNPPVKFTIDSKSSDSLNWSKSVSKPVTVTDYPNDDPVKRTYYTVTYTEKTYGLELVLTVTKYPGYPVVEYSAQLTNTGSSNSKTVRDIKSISADVRHLGSSVTLHAFHGGDYELTEYDPIDKKFGSGSSAVFSVTTGKSTSTYLPNFNIEDHTNKSGIIAVLSWEGTWSSKFENKSNELRWECGQLNTSFALTPGESVSVPLIVMLFYKGDMYNGQNIWRRWFYKHNVLRAQGERMELNLLYCTSQNSPSEANAKDDLACIAMMKQNNMGDYVRSFTQDAGWFDCGGNTHPNAWSNYVGNWYADSTRYPKGLKPVADAAHKAGMGYTLWLEPERARIGTKTFNDLGDNMICLNSQGQYVSYKNANGPVDAMVNLAKPEAVDYLIELLDSIITEVGVDMYRQDCNFCITAGQKAQGLFYMSEYWSAYDKYDSAQLGIQRNGITENHYCTGLLRFWDELVKRHPSLVIDCCASGGQRYTLNLARYSFMHTRTDWIGYTPDNAKLDATVNAQCDSYTLALWYQLTGSGTANFYDLYDVRSRTVTSFGFGIWATTGADFNQCKQIYGIMESYIPYIITGDYYPLTAYSTENKGQMVLQFVNPDDLSCKLNFYIREKSTVTVYPRDIDPSLEYEWWSNKNKAKKYTVSGADLIKNGITISGESKTCQVVTIEKKG